MGHHIQPARYHLRKGDIDTVFIAVDKNQLSGAHEKSNAPNHMGLEQLGHTLVPTVLPYGDYAVMTPQMTDIMKRRGAKLRRWDYMGSIPVTIDRKANVSEIALNIASGKEEHERFINEAFLANRCGARFYVLIEDDHIRSVDDVEKWQNPRAQQYYYQRAMEQKGFKYQRPLPQHPPVNGKSLAKAMRTISYRYGVNFAFCTPQQAPSAIVYLLTH